MISLVLLGAGGLALAWGVHDLAQVFAEVGSCSSDGVPNYCPPGMERSIGATIAGAVLVFAGGFAGTSTRTAPLTVGVLGTVIGVSVGWSQLGPSAQPGDPALVALGVSAIALLVGIAALVGANGTNPPARAAADGSGGSFWSFDGGGDSGSDSGGDSGCGGGCGGGGD
ncbi:MAG: hypothetical protein Q7T55_20545 [Solirubrobacteraceae bacterium]|nr:hypothetical protein [Solirubrobacteraceae bacterium]